MKTTLNKEQSRHLCRIGCKFPYNPAIQDDNGDYYVHITIIDLLEILPKNLEPNKLIDFNLGWDTNKGLWLACYLTLHESKRYAEEPIDALYQLACWYYEEYLKSEKK